MQRFLKLLDYKCFVCNEPIASRECSKGHFRIFTNSKGLVIHTYINIGQFLTTLFFNKELEYLEMYGNNKEEFRIKLNPIQFIKDNKGKGEEALINKFQMMRTFS